MNILSIFSTLITWIFRGVVVKFLIMTALYAVMTLLIPKVIELFAPFIGVTSLNNAFGGIDSYTWWFLSSFRLDYGIPLLLSALVARFLIRRIPFIG